MANTVHFASDLEIAPEDFGKALITIGGKPYQLASRVNNRARYIAVRETGGADAELIVIND